MAIIAAVLLAIVIATVSARGADSISGQLGGDFGEFYGAGRIVAAGDGQHLYDPSRQAAAQADLLAADEPPGGVLFAYPAVVAAPYAALSHLDYRLAYLLNTVAMLGAFALALRLLRPRLALLQTARHRPAAAAFALTFLPLFVGLTGGQNTGLTLLALAVIWWGLDTGRPEWAGLAAGLLLIKPQYALTIIGLLGLTRRWRAVGAAIVGGAVVWIGSALVFGPGWLAKWFHLATSIGTIDKGANLPNEVSWLGLAQVAFGRDSHLAVLLGLGAAGLTGLILLWCLHHRPRVDALSVAVVLPSLLLIAPHALYYDAGLLVVSLGALVLTLPARRRLLVLALWWLAGLGHLVASTWGVDPVAGIVIATWLWAVREATRSSPVDTDRALDPGGLLPTGA